MDDNFYQASSERFIPLTEKQQEKKQLSKTSYERERPLTTEVAEILKKEIESRERVDSITELKDPEAFMRQVFINKEVCSILRRVFNLIETKEKMFDNKKLR